MKILQRSYAHTKISFSEQITILSILFISYALLAGCDLISNYGKYNGIDRIAPRGHPAADSLIWSRTDSNKILVSTSEIGFGFGLDGSQVFVLDIQTGGKKVIANTNNGIINGETWSPDGKVVLDISSSTKGYEDYKGLWIWNASNTPLEFLSEGGKAIWSPDGGKIAILDNSNSGDLEILRLLDINTKHEETLPIGEINTMGYIWGGDWSPDGQRLVLSLGDPKSSIVVNLFIYDIQNQKLVRLTKEGDNFHPVWSPQGNKIAYVKQIQGNSSYSLHLINVDSSCDVEFPYIDWILSLTWSPDGKRLAFIGPDGIYILDLETFMKKYMASSSCLMP